MPSADVNNNETIDDEALCLALTLAGFALWGAAL